MPVTRFRDPDEASRALWLDREDPRLVSAIRDLWRTSVRLAVYPLRRPGVARFRSLDESDADRNHLVDQRIRQLRADRGAIEARVRPEGM